MQSSLLECSHSRLKMASSTPLFIFAHGFGWSSPMVYFADILSPNMAALCCGVSLFGFGCGPSTPFWCIKTRSPPQSNCIRLDSIGWHSRFGWSPNQISIFSLLIIVNRSCISSYFLAELFFCSGFFVGFSLWLRYSRLKTMPSKLGRMYYWGCILITIVCSIPFPSCMRVLWMSDDCLFHVWGFHALCTLFCL